MDVDEENQMKTTITKGSSGHNQIIHVRQDSASELEALFNTVMNPNFKSKSLPMKARKFPKSFFEQPDKPRHSPLYHHGHSQSMGGLSVNTAPPIIHSRSSSSDSNTSHTSVGMTPNTNNNNGASLGSPAAMTGVKGNHKGYSLSPAQRRMAHSPYSTPQNHGNLQVPGQISHARSKSSPASLELMNVAHLQVKASDIPPDMPLPPGWSAAKTGDGQQYFMNHNDRTTTWEDPRIAIIKRQRQTQMASLQQSQSLAVSSSALTPTTIHNNGQPDRTLSSLPPGWEQAKTPQGETYYINHQTRSTSWTDPRLQNVPHQGNNPQNNSQLQQQLMKVNQMEMAGGQSRVVSSGMPPQQQSMLKHFVQEKELLMRKQHLMKQNQSQMSTTGLDPFLGGSGPLNNFHQRDPSQDSGVGMGSNYSLPRTPDDYLGNVEEMDTGDVSRRIHNNQQIAGMVPTTNQQQQQQPVHHIANNNQQHQQQQQQQRFPDFLDTLPSSNVDFGSNQQPQQQPGGNNQPMLHQNNAPLDGNDLVPTISEPLSQDFDVESMLNHVKTENMDSGMIWL